MIDFKHNEEISEEEVLKKLNNYFIEYINKEMSLEKKDKYRTIENFLTKYIICYKHIISYENPLCSSFNFYKKKRYYKKQIQRRLINAYNGDFLNLKSMIDCYPFKNTELKFEIIQNDNKSKKISI